MSSQRTKNIDELIQILRILSNNPEMVARNPEIIEDMMKRITAGATLFPTSFVPSSREERELGRQVDEQTDELCRKIKTEVLEQLRSEKQSLLKSTLEATSESIRRISEIQEVKKIYAFTEPENVKLIIIHDASDRIGLLRSVVEIENLLDEKFEDIYFEFNTLHYSEIDENLISDGLLIFSRS